MPTNAPPPAGWTAAYQARLSALIADGMTKADAVRHIVKHEPTTHARYIAAANHDVMGRKAWTAKFGHLLTA